MASVGLELVQQAVEVSLEVSLKLICIPLVSSLCKSDTSPRGKNMTDSSTGRSRTATLNIPR